MSLPRKPAGAGRRPGRCAAGLAALLLLGLLQAAPARADAQQDPYSVTVKVDATAGNAVEARRIARLDGQRQALGKLVEQLSGSSDIKLPKLDDNAITDMVDNFEVADEHMSAVRYLAQYTFHFRPARVRHLMQSAGIAPAGTAGNTEAGNAEAATPAPGNAPAGTGGAVAGDGKGAVLLPVFGDGSSLVLWDDPNPWRDAWAQRPAGSGPTRIDVPLGGVGDLSVIDAAQAVAGKSDSLAAIAAHEGGGSAIVALATAERQGARLTGLNVSIKRYADGRLAGAQSETFSIRPGESEGDFMARAVGGTAAAIESGANEFGAGNGPPASLTAIVPLNGLGDWIAVRDRLAAVPAVHRVDLLSLSRQEARIEITYSGTEDDLRSSLAGANLDLGGGAPTWQVRPAAAGQPH